jgi:hypothetical protein
LRLSLVDWREALKDDDEDGYPSTALEARWEEVAKAQGEERADTLAAIHRQSHAYRPPS